MDPRLLPYYNLELQHLRAHGGRVEDAPRIGGDLEALDAAVRIRARDRVAAVRERSGEPHGLERAVDEHAFGLVYLTVDPVFDEFRRLARFQAIERRVARIAGFQKDGQDSS